MVTTAHSETMTADKALAVYGKSFHWARRFLGQHMGMKAARLYQFCRVLDDMADGDIEHGPKRLGRIRKDLLTAGTASDPLLSHFQPFLSKQKFSTKVIVALIDGLLSDQKPVRIKSDAELLSYAYHVAGTVGILMCNVLDCDDEQALGHAIDLGIAMQLTNIARDVLEDAGMGRRYLPASWVGNLAPKQIVALAKHLMPLPHCRSKMPFRAFWPWPMIITKVALPDYPICHCERIYRLLLPRLSIGKLASSLRSKTTLGMAAAKAPA